MRFGQDNPTDGSWGRRALAALDSALDAVVCVDDQGRVVAWNDAAGDLLGWDGPETAVLRAAAPGERSLQEDIDRVLADPERAPRRFERRVLGRDDAVLQTEASVTGTEFEGRTVATLFLRDLTAAKRTEHRRTVEHRLARVLAAARSGEEVARGVLEMLGTGLGFDHAELWLADDHQEGLRLTAAWRRRPAGPFAESARHLVLGRGEDLAGMAWEIGETVCVDDAAPLEGLARADAIAAEGIHACAALPLRAGNLLIGVGVLARTSPEPLDPELRQTLHSVAIQLGHFGERRAAERRLAEETVALASVARATRALTGAVDNATARNAICQAALEISGATCAFLALPDDENGGLVIRASAPADAVPSPVGYHYAADAPSGAMRAFTSRESIFLSDIAAEPSADVERAKAAGMVSGLVQPILREDEVLGVLGFAWAAQQTAIDSSTRLLVRLLASEAAMALSRVELVARLETAARTDPLTGLANLRAWEEHLGRELSAATRDGRAVAVAILDLDGFKELNDRVGHQGGDRVLRTSAAKWQAQLRQGDLLARLGGDEFGALLPGCHPDDALMLAERLRRATTDITTSVGIAYWDGSEELSGLMRRADAALYAAKAAGRDRVASR